jgi:hypothetical protein
MKQVNYMAAISRFDATAIDTTQRDYENLPDGTYRLEVIKSEVVPTKKGDGTRLNLVYAVIEPEDYKGRQIFGGINLENPNAVSQELGQKELASLCRAVGLAEIEDSDALHFIGFTAKIGLGKPSKEKNPDGSPLYPPKAEIRRFYFEDSDDIPEIGVTVPVAANDNKPAPRAANDNTPPRGDARTTGNGGAAATKARPWGKKAA